MMSGLLRARRALGPLNVGDKVEVVNTLLSPSWPTVQERSRPGPPGSTRPVAALAQCLVREHCLDYGLAHNDGKGYGSRVGSVRRAPEPEDDAGLLER
jgi:hypothetical protein